MAANELVCPDASLLDVLDRVLAADVHYHLFVNNHHPTKASVLADFTEVVVAGYAPIAVAAADWIAKFVIAHRGIEETAPIVFLNSSAATIVTVWGYFITDSTDALLLFALEFPASRQLLPLSVPFPITPRMGDFSTYG